MKKTHESEMHAADARPAPAEVLAALGQKVASKPKELLLHTLDDPRAIEALGELCDHSPTEFDALIANWQALGATIRDTEKLTRAVRAEVRQRRNLHAVGADDGRNPVRVKAVFSNAPVCDQLIVPPNWSLGENGVYRSSIDRDLASPSPIIISGRLKDSEDGSEAIELVWMRDGSWQRRVVDRETIAGWRKLTELARFGLPVTSGTSHTLVKFLAEFEAANLRNLPVSEITHQLGWQGAGGKLGFLWGERLIRPAAGVAPMNGNPDQSEGNFGSSLYFRGKGDGAEQLARGYHSKGSMAGWREAASIMPPNSNALVTFYASLSAALLLVLDAPNYILDLWNDSSSGKTTALRFAASVWGNPDDRADATSIHTWDASPVAIEILSETVNGLPLILDDTNRATDPRIVTQVIYKVASGQGRARGSVHGLLRGARSRTVVISSGQAPAAHLTQDGGPSARTLSLPGPPWGSVDETATLVDKVDGLIRHNYGHVGPRFVQFLVNHRSKWAFWRATHRQREADFIERAQGSAILIRLAKFVALLDVTAWLAECALHLPWEYEPLIEHLWDQVVRQAQEADTAQQALSAIFDWAQGNRQAFLGGLERTDSHDDPIPPFAGWAGQWVAKPDWDSIAFIPIRLHQELQKLGYKHPRSIIRSWRDRGWLITDAEDDRLTRKMRFNDNPNARLIVIRRVALEDLKAD